MSLTPEQVKFLLALPQRKRGGQGKKSSGIDMNDRSHATWFKLAHKLFDAETQEMPECSNPNCPDDRPKAKAVVAEVDGVLMCRHCFLAGWGVMHPDQTKIPT